MRSVFLCLLTLIAGIALGLLLSFTLFDSSRSYLNVSTQISAASDQQSEALSAAADEAAILAATPTPSPDLSSNCILLNRAFNVLTALQAEDYSSLANMVHPQKGVTFTPYSTVDAEANLVFSANEISRAADNTEKYIWGLTDGQGTPIKLTISEYFAQYVYNEDYLQAPEIGVDQIMASGNSIENVTEAYPEARFVEFHFPGLVENKQGFDWCSLKLVFEAYQGDYRLVGIIHSQWTV